MIKKRLVDVDGQVLGEVEGENLQDVFTNGIKLHQKTLGSERVAAEDLMFSHAKQFHDVVSCIFPTERTGKALSKLTAFCVNAAFALEVYLKLLHRVTQKTNAGGHKLKDLYNGLPVDTKNELED